MKNKEKYASKEKEKEKEKSIKKKIARLQACFLGYVRVILCLHITM